LVLNEDQFKGNWKQFKGEPKKWANFTDDDLLYIGRVSRQARGKNSGALWRSKRRGEQVGR
jgi:uncharacterized protein YjbJ (UPF0337 family)